MRVTQKGGRSINLATYIYSIYKSKSKTTHFIYGKMKKNNAAAIFNNTLKELRQPLTLSSCRYSTLRFFFALFRQMFWENISADAYFNIFPSVWNIPNLFYQNVSDEVYYGSHTYFMKSNRHKSNTHLI